MTVRYNPDGSLVDPTDVLPACEFKGFGREHGWEELPDLMRRIRGLGVTAVAPVGRLVVEGLVERCCGSSQYRDDHAGRPRMYRLAPPEEVRAADARHRLGGPIEPPK